MWRVLGPYDPKGANLLVTGAFRSDSDGKAPCGGVVATRPYPRRSLRDDVMSGRLRMRGFSDFGPSLALRLDGPLH
jgi:hypothetical protein